MTEGASPDSRPLAPAPVQADGISLRRWRPDDAEWYVAARDDRIFRWTREDPELTVPVARRAIEAGGGEIPRTVPAVIETSGEGLCCGYDSGLPVTDDYEAPFRFTGRIARVVVEVEGEPDQDDEGQLRSVMIEQ